jgi:hypothetical protein
VPRHRVGGGEAPVGLLDGDPGAADQDVVEVEGAFVGGGVDGLGDQVLLGAGEGPGQLRLLGAQGEDLVDGGAVPVQEVLDLEVLDLGDVQSGDRRFQAAA